MGPTAPAPLTRAAARKRALGHVHKSDVRPRLMHVLALSGGAFAGALIVLGIGSLVGVPSMDSPPREVSNAEQVAVPTPRPTPVTRLPSAIPSEEAVAPEDTAAPVPPVTVPSIAPAAPDSAAPDPAPSTPPTEPVADAPVTESEKGKSAEAPGRDKKP